MESQLPTMDENTTKMMENESQAQGPTFGSGKKLSKQIKLKARKKNKSETKSESKPGNTSDPDLRMFSNSKLLLEKLHTAFDNCLPNCKTCEKYIQALSEHIQKRHGLTDEFNDLAKVTPRLRRGRGRPKKLLDNTKNGNKDYECPALSPEMESIEVKVEMEDFEFDSEQFNECPLSYPIIPGENVNTADYKPLGIENYFQDLPENIDDSPFGMDNSYEVEIPTKTKPKSAAKKFKEPTIPCSMCPKKISTQRHLTRHLQRGHLPKNCKSSSSEFPLCQICERHYPDKYLAQHMLKTHAIKNPKDPIYLCRICKTDFITNTQAKLNNHFVDLHPGEKPYVCEFCGLGCSEKCTFRYHLRVHTGEKPFSCEMCPESFSLKKYLNRHMIIHSAEGPNLYTCETCGHSYKSKGCLVNHRRTHTGEKPFMCEVCSKCFTVGATLTRHMLTHKGERKFICEYCQKGFITRDNLKFHEKIHTGKKEIVCEICGKRFQWQHVLKGHMRSHER